MRELDKLSGIKSNIDEYQRRQLRLAMFGDKNELEFHQYIKGICQRLLGNTVDLDKEQIMFALSDNKEKNAAFVHAENKYKIIFITQSLFDLCENEDQLAFVLAHELGHYEEYLRQGQHLNTKAEEAAADLRAIQKMGRGGYNLEEAHNIAKKLFTGGYFSIESLKDEHINNTTRKNAIDAMIIAQKKILIEEGKEDVKTTTQIDKNIRKIIDDRPVPLSFIELLNNKISNAETTEDAVKFWLETFHENKIFKNGEYIYTKDEIKDFAWAINSICTDKVAADKFFGAVLFDLEKNKDKPECRYDRELISNIFYEIYTYDNRSYSHTVVNADKEDSITAGFLRYYLKGFREATGPEAIKMIQKFNRIKTLTATHNGDDYKGILVKNFNLMEFEFNQNDVNKKISPEILQLIKSSLNAKNVFETFSGLTVNKLGDNLLFTQASQNWSLFVTRDGVVKYSFPAENLEQIQTKLVSEVIENTYKDVVRIKNNEVTSPLEQLRILENAYNILYPQAAKNNLSHILQVNASDKQILFDDVVAEISGEAKEFLSEKIMYPHTPDNLPYTTFVTDKLAECIKNAPKEEMNNIFNYLYLDSSSRGHWKSFGNIKLWQAFLDNPEFAEEIKSKIQKTDLLPNERNEWSIVYIFDDEEKLFLDSIVSRLTAISDDALYEHLINGGDFNTFEPPFAERISKLCGFGKDGLSAEDIEESFKQSFANEYAASFLQQAYMLCYSYDTLKDGAKINLNKTFGANKAGIEIGNKKRILEHHLKEAEKYAIDEKEAQKIQKEIEKLDKVYKKIHQKEVEQVYTPSNWERFDGTSLFYAVLHNKEGVPSFRSIVERKDFKDILLKKYTNDDDRHSCILALGYIVNENASDKKNNEIKKQIWPIIATVFDREDITTRDKVKTFMTLAENNIFASDNKEYYSILIGEDGKSGLLAEISKESKSVQFELYKLLLEKYSRIPDPQIREDVVKKAANVWWELSGRYNDISATDEQRAKLIEEIKKIKEENIAETDKIELLKEFSELTLSQKELSLFMKPEITELQTSHGTANALAYSIDGLSFILHSYPTSKSAMQEFLLGEGKAEEAEKLIKEIHISVCREYDGYNNTNLTERYLKGEDITKDLPYYTVDYINKLNVGSLITLKKEFDAAQLEVKALMVNELLTTGKSSWEDSFNVVSEKLFEGAGELAQVGSDFLYNYISARPDSEKTFYLAAMMAAANNKSKQFAKNYGDSPYTPEQRNLAKGLRMFLESSGPAGTKLAQAMSSYSLVPDFIRYEMQFAKSQANPPARWDIFSDQSEVMDTLLQYGPLGKRKGSASFFVTYDLGDKIVKILRRGAKAKADKEFEIYKSMLEKLSENYDNMSSFSRLIKNAADNVSIETDLEIGLAQYKDAKKLYPTSVEADSTEFKINVMDWISKSSSWAIMEKASGVDFKDLEQPYKKTVAKAIFTTELSNMLSGKRFDSDRHSGQYKINPDTNEIGVFDTGSISIVEPTKKEQKVLGIVLARTIKGLRYDMNVANVFSKEIDKAVEEFYGKEINANKEVPPYLSEFQRGLLALNDFYSELSAKEMMECVLKSFNNGHNKINDNIVNGFKAELTQKISSNSMESVLNPEPIDKLAPEARAKRKIGKILFNKVFESLIEDKKMELNPETLGKLMPHLQNDNVDLQIVKGFVRGAAEKLNPDNYSKEDKEELGKVLYRVCCSDVLNKKLRKESDIQELFSGAEGKGQYCQNISAILKMLSKVSSVDADKIKRAAVFVAFADPNVAKGWKQALKEDKSISLGKRLLMSIKPMDFIPEKSKKLLIKSVGKRLILGYINKKFNLQSNKNSNQH